MRRFCLGIIVLLAFNFVASQQRPSSLASSPKWKVGQPIIHENLAVFPVKLESEVPEGDYLTLKEAQKEGLVVVSELPEGASVSHVLVENKADKPLLLLGGEVILGGKQDRIVEHDTIVPPKTKMKVKVYCVEPGRWTPEVGKGIKFEAPMAMVAPDVRRSAQVAKDQGKVWAENETVQRQILVLAAEPSSPSKSYRRVLTSEQVRQETQAYVRAIQAQLRKEPKVCGIIVAVNGRLGWLDVFGSPRLFQKVSPALLNSAAVQALTKRRQEAQRRVPSVADARRFLTEVQRGQRRLEQETGRTVLHRAETRSVIGFSTRDKRAPSGPMPATSASPPVHMNAYRK